ncbi:TonB-dependent receptor [Segetibacter aerophilus]|uniref:TonB-dependent receptor n=1 Tax=Segetibacter aerophilus TaxID=670293 RepID=A0A512BJA0_9BACT|nr:TonB-dependent receptor [Segetibacter aerophilus]GEO12049.1 TonB-dependent receptor [Segetibacter aerophilus]
MKLLLLSILVALSLGITKANGQDSSAANVLTGQVVNGGNPVAYATVIPEGKRRGVVTDERGIFSIMNVTPGKIRLHFSAVGYQHLIKEVEIHQGKNVLENVELALSSNTLDNVVVSGTMRAVSKMASPIPVEVYTPVLFKKNPTPNIFESLQMVNGVQPQLNCNVCNTGDIHINGMEGPYTMILIDGMPIVSSLSTVYGLAGIPNSLVKQIEIVKGPASTLYGSEAVGGLINIITKDPLTADKLKIDFSATSVGEYNSDITAKFKVGKTASIIGINYFNYWNKRDINNDFFTDITLQRRFSIFNKWNFARKNNRSATLALRYVNENRFGGDLRWDKTFRGSDSIYGESIYTNRFELIGNYELGKNLYADLSYNYHLQDSYYGTTKYYANQHVAFGQLRWNNSFGKHELLSGLPFRFTSYDDNSPATEKDGVNHPDKIILPGVFVQDEYKVSDKFTTLLGLRYDYNNIHGSILTPRLSFKFSPDANNTVRLSGGNGYRVVNLFTEDHAALTGARDVVIAEALKPEQSWNVNLNYTRQMVSDNVSITLDGSAFYTYFTNKIVGDFITDPNKIIYDNLRGYAISKGLTLNTDFSFAHRFKINAGVTFMDVYEMDKDSTGRTIKIPQLFAPAFSGTYAVSYSIPRFGLSIDWTGRVNGPMYLPVLPKDFRPDRSPFYCIMNLQATKTFSNRWEVYGGVKNLLNFLPKNPLIHSDDPFDKAGGKYFDINGNPRPDTNPNAYVFDLSYNYAPIQRAKGFIGVRWTIK